ncbi:Kinase-like protein [Mycena sanguinolenta]|uniref:Kinase-like protein n=1 Tax=Mycena sanguinolenta TaxID=230812 RepID=A0A8H6Z7Y6_9AGAR|nr:Kinase-like protein [Mycena sanguinolenta]
MRCDSVLSAIVESLSCRKRVLELSNRLELTNDPNLRTAIRADEERIASFLVSILSSKSDEERVLRLEGDSAQHFLDVVQETLNRGFIVAQEHTKMARRIIRKLSALCDRLPSSLFISGVTGQDEHPTFWGGYGDIYRASYGNQHVALKRMRHFQPGSDLRRKRLKFCREALVWKDLHHPHILPFLGIDANSFPLFLCMVSPWMEHGTVLNYLRTHGHAYLDKLLYEIAQGLEYLHSRNVVHGDLRGANILIKEDWTACLADFGLSILSDTTSTASTNRGGSTYWMAPELLDPDRFGIPFARTPATDVYAFGCVCLELYTGRHPFWNVPETAALLKVINGERPERPPGPPAMLDTVWQHVTEFWAQDPSTRPSAQSVVQAMAWRPPGPKPCPSPLPGPRPMPSVPFIPGSPPALALVKGSIPTVIPTAKRMGVQPDISSSIPFSTDIEPEKNLSLQPDGLVSDEPPSPSLLHLLAVLADGGIGTAEYAVTEYQWPEVELQDASLTNPEARGFIWIFLYRLSGRRRRRSLPSTTIVLHGDVTERLGVPVDPLAEASSGSESSGLSKASSMRSRDTDVTSPNSSLPYLSVTQTPVDPDLPSSTSLVHADDGTTWEGSRAHAIEETFVQNPNASMLSHDHSLEDVAYNADGYLLGATMDVLVENMTPHDNIVDPAFSAVFFLTFRLFSSPIELVDTIIRRYNLLPPDGISNEDVQLWQHRKGIPVRLRVSNFIKMWVKIYWQPGVDDPALESLAAFARDGLAAMSPGPARWIQDLIERRRKTARSMISPKSEHTRVPGLPIGEIPSAVDDQGVVGESAQQELWGDCHHRL